MVAIIVEARSFMVDAIVKKGHAAAQSKYDYRKAVLARLRRAGAPDDAIAQQTRSMHEALEALKRLEKEGGKNGEASTKV